MIPLELRIRGFFSYKEEQVVDFRQLYRAGFFGFLGPTGAGKSALLEAILIALYADSARVYRSPTTVKNIQSKDAKIELTFQVLDQIYKATYEISGRGSGEHKLISLNGPEGTELIAGGSREVSAKVQELIGLSYEQFTLAFLLQQGRFMEFLNMTASERRKVLQSLFHVERYDLHAVVSRLHDSVKSDIKNKQEIKAKLEERAHAEREEQKRRELHGIQQKIQEIEQRIQVVQKEISQMAGKVQLYQEWREKARKLEAMLRAAEQQRERQAHLSKLQAVVESLSDLWREEEELTKEIAQKEEELKKLIAAQKALLSEQSSLRQEIEKLTPEYQQKATLEAQKNAWEKVQSYQHKQKQYEHKNAELSAIEESLAQMIEKQKEVETKKKEAAHKLEALENELTTQWPGELFEWYSVRDRGVQEAEKLRRECQEVEKRLLSAKRQAYEQLASLWQQIEALHKAATEPELRQIFQKIPSLPSFEETVACWKEVQEVALEALREAYLWLTSAMAAGDLAKHLSDGVPCPVCGSTHHPQKATHPPHLKTQRNHIEALGKNLKALSLEKLLREEQTHTEARNRYLQIEEEKKRHEAHFQWKHLGHAPDEPTDQKRKQKKDLESQREALRAEQARWEKEREELFKAIEAKQAQKQRLVSELAQLQGEMAALRNDIIAYLGEEVLGYSPTEVAEKKEHITKKLEALQDFPEKAAKLQAIEKEIASYEGQITAIKTAIENTKTKLADTLDKQREQAQRVEISLEQANMYRGIDLNTIRSELEGIQRFLMELDYLQQEVAKGKADLGEEDLEAIYRQKEEERRLLDKELNQLHQQQGQVWAELRDIQEARQELDRLEKGLAELTQRATYLHELTNLFRGGGFVQFVLQKRFERLIEEANRYFARWTHGQLRLVATPGELEVKVEDALAGGKQRDVRSLSGGQTFEASLALALALSDQVLAQYGGHRQGVFFIDEGFGSLDEESLYVVAQVLRELTRQGHRAIGVVTHREELKELLEAYVEVRLDEARGSLLSPLRLR